MPNTDDPFYRDWSSEDGKFHVVIEEENDAVYAYLVEVGDGKNTDLSIAAVVWLYNLRPAPESPPWKDNENKYGKGPFPNPRTYLWEEQLVPEDPERQIHVFCTTTPETMFQAEIAVEVRTEPLKLTLLAVLRENEKTGWCRNARQDGPCAKSLNSILETGFFIGEAWKKD